jgi:hypothetical protein
MRRIVAIGACSAGLLGFAVPAAASQPLGEPAPAGALSGPAEDPPAPQSWDGAPSGASGQVVVMTLSKPRPNPEPRASSPQELRKHASSRRPQ